MSDEQPKSLAEIRVLLDTKMQFNETKSMYGMMCGNLYPGILYEKLLVLKAKYVSLGGCHGDLDLPRSPDSGGYAR